MGETGSCDSPEVPLTIGFYFLVSIALVFVNKSVLSGPDSVAAPMFVVWFQLLISLVCLVLFGAFGKRWTSLNFPSFEFNPEKASKLLNLNVIFLGMFIFNNLCLMYVEVSFYQVARSLTVVFNVLMLQLYHETPSLSVKQSCGIALLGFVLASIGEPNFNWPGVIFGAASSVFVGLYSMYVKRALPLVDGNHWRLMMYTTVMSLVSLMPILVLSGELSTLRDVETTGRFWFLLIVTGLLGFFINIAIFLQYKYTTPLMQNVSATAKACVQTALAFWIYQNETSMLNIVGIAMVIGGYLWYSHIRAQESQVEVKAKEETTV